MGLHTWTGTGTVRLQGLLQNCQHVTWRQNIYQYKAKLGRGMCLNPQLKTKARFCSAPSKTTPSTHFWHYLTTCMQNYSLFCNACSVVVCDPLDPHRIHVAVLLNWIVTCSSSSWYFLKSTTPQEDSHLGPVHAWDDDWLMVPPHHWNQGVIE